MRLQIDMSEGFYVCSDCHFFHENIIKYCNRPFKSAEEMNEVIYTNWNATIPKDAKVFFLGDWVIGTDRKYSIGQVLHDELNGRKVFIKGNHDEKIQKYTSIKVVDGIIEVQYRGFSILMSHYPIYEFDHDLQICGHIHNNEENEKLKWNMINVSMEVTDYKPVHIDGIIEEVKKRAKNVSPSASKFLNCP